MSFLDRLLNRPVITLRRIQEIVVEGAIVDFRLSIRNSLFQYYLVNGRRKFLFSDQILSLSVYETVVVKIVAVNLIHFKSVEYEVMSTIRSINGNTISFKGVRAKRFRVKKLSMRARKDPKHISLKPIKSINSIQLKQINHEPRLL